MQKVIEHLGEVLLVIAIIAVLIGVGVYVTDQVGNKISHQITELSPSTDASDYDWSPSSGE